jgi:hypothetical protein
MTFCSSLVGQLERLANVSPIARRLLRLGIELMPHTGIRSFHNGIATLENELSRARSRQG